jgi:hypothetical protein
MGISKIEPFEKNVLWIIFSSYLVLGFLVIAFY